MLLNEESRPTIIIHANKALSGKNILNQICYGIEEEGIPYEVILVEKCSDYIQMAYDACQQSRLGVGIGVSDGSVALHYEKLRKDSPLFNISVNDGMEKVRAIGQNSARLVKRMPFNTFRE
ncbi:glycerol dehydratase reactivase beta/small subunit family protein [Sinanaerobacter sp. ZZT-01]|uniref:glycerol dehydratase reactivase beta/small subunit family protein n=1 Tax=Sinanaerobacter sp. ZZT-01 TaxID=3111540 RepID=UPI002D7837AA|nr:glycerol dehydratase reactivase beta/small subunit family protein [Sinanaerobacter sp. ZZT-01]WRR92627.1 glycerol dehydratase reactivase beta/small subunit family protein [Sinanaerobacter sp. ZZT-01]